MASPLTVQSFSFTEEDHFIYKATGTDGLPGRVQLQRHAAWRHVVGRQPCASVAQVDQMVQYLAQKGGADEAVRSLRDAVTDHHMACNCAVHRLKEFGELVAFQLAQLTPEPGCWATVEEGGVRYSGYKPDTRLAHDLVAPGAAVEAEVVYDPQLGVGHVVGPNSTVRTMYRLQHPAALTLLRRTYEERALKELMGLDARVLDVVAALSKSDATVSRRNSSQLATEWNMYRMIREARCLVSDLPNVQVDLVVYMLNSWDRGLDELLDSLASATR